MKLYISKYTASFILKKILKIIIKIFDKYEKDAYTEYINI